MTEPISTFEIADAIRKDLVDVRAISLTQAALQLGKKPNNLYNILNGKSRISRNTAAQFHKEFGYSIDFITKGIGSLYSSGEENEISDIENDDEESPAFYLDNIEGLSERETILNNYARGFGLILSKALALIPKQFFNYWPSSDLSEITTVTNGRTFLPQSRDEKRLMKSILQSYSFLKQILDINRILDDLEGTEGTHQEK